MNTSQQEHRLRSRSDALVFAPFAVEGFSAGQVSDAVGKTGCTVFLFEQGATVGADVRGAAPGSRELALLEPGNLVEKVHAVVLAGGSAYGLAAMSGVARFLEEKDVGYETGVARVPIVCGAVLFDLGYGNPQARPDEAMGYLAAKNANRVVFEEGNFGVGTGATLGKAAGMKFAAKGGIGSATYHLSDGVLVTAFVVVNALGDVFAGETQISGMRAAEGKGWRNTEDFLLTDPQTEVFPGSNTTLGVVITNTTLSKAQARRLAQTTHDAFARRIRPVHTSFDGDIVFAAATNELPLSDELRLSVAANRAMEAAILRAVG